MYILNHKKFHLPIVIFFLIGVCVAESQTLSKKNVNQPNVILIMTDDMGIEALGTYGSAEYSTPTLDKLAENGVKFINAHSQPICTPSRVKIMTGKYNFRNYTEFGYLSPDEKTFGNIFQGAGYSTLIAGKWQLNGIYRDKKPGWNDLNRPFHFGFDEYILWQVNKNKSRGERYANPLLVKNGEYLPQDPDKYGPDVISDYILEFIDRKKEAKQPFFVYYPMVMPHSPYVPTPDSPEWKDPSKRYDHHPKFFKDMVAYIDKIVNKIVTKVEDSGLKKNTLIIFTSDNGTGKEIESKMQDGSIVKGSKGKMIDWGTHVPLIAYWEGKSLKGSVNTDLIDFSDVLPTLQDAANIPIKTWQVLDGQSFLPQIIGEPSHHKQFMYMYYKPDWLGWTDELGVYVRTQKYKLYGNGNLYNTQADVEEKNNLSLSELSEDKLNKIKKMQNTLDQKPDIIK